MNPFDQHTAPNNPEERASSPFRARFLKGQQTSTSQLSTQCNLHTFDTQATLVTDLTPARSGLTLSIPHQASLNGSLTGCSDLGGNDEGAYRKLKAPHNSSAAPDQQFQPDHKSFDSTSQVLAQTARQGPVTSSVATASTPKSSRETPAETVELAQSLGPECEASSPEDLVEATDPGDYDLEEFSLGSDPADNASEESLGSDPGDTKLDMGESEPSKLKERWESQNYYYNNREARLRADKLITWAMTNVLSRQRASPTGKEKAGQIQELMADSSLKGESNMPSAMEAAIINKCRLIKKPDAPPQINLDIYHYQSDPRAWKDDFLDSKTRATFKKDYPPQVKGSAATLLAELGGLADIRGCVPDIVWGLGKTLLPANLRAVLDKCNVEPTDMLYLPFCVAESKTQNRPIAEAEAQALKDLASMVDCCVQFYDQVAEKEKRTLLPGKGTGTSFFDEASVCFAAVVVDNATAMHLGCREVWENGVTYFHAFPIAFYYPRYGFDESTAQFQSHLSNILDWGVQERADAIIEGAVKIGSRTVKRELTRQDLFQ